jgi:hypothetical protein
MELIRAKAVQQLPARGEKGGCMEGKRERINKRREKKKRVKNARKKKRDELMPGYLSRPRKHEDQGDQAGKGGAPLINGTATTAAYGR